MNAIILPGNGCCDINSMWYPQVKEFLESKGITVTAQNMPDPDLARKEFWIPFIEQHADQDTILIGHSSGAVASMRYAETHKVKGIILVGACYTDLDNEMEKLSGYYDEPWKWGKIKENTGWIVQFASEDDPWIPIEEPRHITKMLDCEYFEFKNRGHFMEDDFPELLEVVVERM